jgi:prepilin-type N-terminal cleavage/methylation domain-containing protein
MTAQKNNFSGFTLIELLTVIAIIGILASMIAVALPRALEKAKIAKLEGLFNQMRIILTEYNTDSASFPPGYGYVSKEAFLSGYGYEQLRQIYPMYRVNAPYMSYIRAFGTIDLYDPFSFFGSDTDQDGNITPLEFMPLGQADRYSRGSTFFLPDIYPAGNTGSDRDRQLLEEQRPFVYIPVYKRHFEKYRKFLYQRARSLGTDPRPRIDDPQSPLSTSIGYPPQTYDSAVLISVGPRENTFELLQFFFPDTEWGLTPADEANLAPEYKYHALGMMAYFMATRDFDNNGLLDFDFLARTRQGEARNPDNYLPGESPNAHGPIIFVLEP